MTDVRYGTDGVRGCLSDAFGTRGLCVEDVMGLEVSVAGAPAVAEVAAPATSAPSDTASAAETPAEGSPPARADLPAEQVSILERFFLRRLQSGDPRAFRELVRRHQDRVYSLALRMLGDAHEAEDVSQDVFLSAHRNLARFRGDCRLSTWLYRVTRNHCLNRLKYLERREGEGLPRGPPEGDVVQAELALVAPPDRPDRVLLGAEERVHVHAALHLLSAEHRLLVILRDIEGLSYEEIARIAELPGGTVKSRLHRARAALADALTTAGMAPDSAQEG
jgi:RNA polymerase sigma-70 factor (ECF subfamily)